MHYCLNSTMQGWRAGAPGEILGNFACGVRVVDGLAGKIGVDAAGCLDNGLLGDVVPDFAGLVEAGAVGPLGYHDGVETGIIGAEIADAEHDAGEGFGFGIG